MALFKDPIRALSFELSAGWAYDLLYCTLTDFFFARWDRPEEMLVVHLRRASVAADSPDEEWLGKIRGEVGEKPLFDIDTPNGRAVAVDFVSGPEMTQRVAFLRGTHVDIAVEQRNPDMSVAEPWAALSTAIKTASSDANLPLDGEFSPVDFNKTIEAANKAFEKKDYDAVAQALQEAIRIGTNAWLCSLTSPTGAPEIHATVRVAQAMVHLGKFTGQVLLLRDAATILRRALCSLESAGIAASEGAQGLVSELKEILDDIESELLEKKDSEAGNDSAPIISIRERGFRLAQAAAAAFDARDFDIASEYAEAAAADFLFLLVYFRRGRAQQIPDEILKHLVDQGISDHEEQRDAIQQAREGTLFPALNLSLQIRYCCALEKKDSQSALDAAELYLPLARQIARSSPDDISISINLVLALLDAAGAVAAAQDKERLQEGLDHLEAAARILEATGDKQCPDDGWVRNYGQQVESSRIALDQRLSKAKEKGDASLESGLQAFRSEFERVAGSLKEKISRGPSPD
jgi:hypothetical protein